MLAFLLLLHSEKVNNLRFVTFFLQHAFVAFYLIFIEAPHLLHLCPCGLLQLDESIPENLVLVNGLLEEASGIEALVSGSAFHAFVLICPCFLRALLQKLTHFHVWLSL